MSDLIERLRRKKYTSAKPPYDRYQVNPDGQEAADEIERLQALYDREKAARYISVDEAISEARRQAFIEAAEIAENPFAHATKQFPDADEIAADIASAIRTKAKEISNA